MSLPRSRELVAIYTQARDIARKAGRAASTAHLLLALFTVPNRAAVFLTDRSITVDALLEAMRSYPGEPSEVLERVEGRSSRIASGSGAESVNSLHLLASLVRETSSHAYRLLEDTGVEVAVVRTAVMSYATGSRSLPRRFIDAETVQVNAPAVARQIPSREHAPSPIGFHPSLGIDAGGRGFQRAETTTLERSRDSEMHATETAETYRPGVARRRPEPTVEEPVTLDLEEEAPIETAAPEPEADPLDEARRTARRLAESLAQRRKAVIEERKRREQQVTAEAKGPEPESEVLEFPKFPQKPVQVARQTDLPKSSSGDDTLAAAYRLDPDEYPTLHKFGRNLTVEAALGRIDSVIGRDREVMQLIDIIGKRRSNNPILVGEAGDGEDPLLRGERRRRRAHGGGVRPDRWSHRCRARTRGCRSPAR